MAITVKHKFVSAIPDAGDPTIVQPSNWNDTHDLTGTVPVANGGTGASTATDGLNNLLPSQTGNNGKVLATDGTNANWTTSGSGDVVGPASATDNAVARFDTTTGKLIQNSVTTIDDTGNASGILSQQFSNGSALTVAAGKLWYDGSDGTWNAGMGGGNITQQIGEELFVYGKAGATITDSPLQIVYQTSVVGASGHIVFNPTVAGITDANLILGCATENISIGNFGRITTYGTIHGITTNGTAYGETWADGDIIWYNPVTGNPTKNKPTAPNIKVQLGIITHAGSGGSGSFFVLVNIGSVLGGTDSNVQLTSATNGNILTYDGGNGYWKNTDLTAGTGISVSKSVNGVLTVTNTSPSSGGTVTSVTGTAPVVSSGGNTPAISMPAATGSVNGYLTSTDWTTFNGKANAGANTNITSVALTTGTISTAPTSSTDIVNKSYADSISAGVNFHAACNYATATALPANTYNNGTSGVGATLTATSNGALVIDGHTFVSPAEVGFRVLIKNESTQANNGIYTVTQVGSGSLPYILTRATDYDSSGSGPNEIDAGDMVLVLSGSTNANTSWVQQTPLPITVGTTALVFIEFAKVQTYTAGTGLTLSTNQFSITNTGTAGTYGSASLIPVITTNAQGQVTGVTTASNPQGTVTSVGGTGTVNGISLSGTVTSTGNLTLGGTLTGVSLATQVTGTLPVANGGTGATTLTGLVVGNGTSAMTTVTAPSGTVVGTTDTQTLTNKRVTPRVGSNGATTSGNITPTGDTADQYNITGLTGTSAIQIPSGTPTDAQKLSIRIEDNGTGRTLSWVTTAGGYRVIGTTLPTTTVANKAIYVGCIYNSADSFWDVVAVASEV